MQSTLTSRDADPHDIFVVEPDVVLAARADAAPDPISSLLAPPPRPAPDLAATAAVPPVQTTRRASANDDIQIPRDIHVGGERPRGRWAGRAVIGFLFALCSAAAAEGWDHYGDTAKAMIANWTPVALNAFSLNASQPADASNPAQPAVSAVQAAAADQTPAQPAPAAQPAQAAAPTGTASTAAAPAASAPDTTQSLQSMAQDVASMGQQIAALKASIEQLKASQNQMAQQMSRDAARTPVARTSQARPSSETRSVEQSLHAKVTAALRPSAPRRPRPAAYPPAQANMALPPAIAAPPMPPQPAPMYEPRAQAVDQADGDTVVRPPMPVR